MPLFMDAIGVLCIGIVQCYLFIFTLRRLLPPITTNLNWVDRTTSFVTVIAALGVTGYIGEQSAVLPQGSMIGPYGIGLLIGLITNITVIIWLDSKQRA